MRRLLSTPSRVSISNRLAMAVQGLEGPEWKCGSELADRRGWRHDMNVRRVSEFLPTGGPFEQCKCSPTPIRCLALQNQCSSSRSRELSCSMSPCTKELPPVKEQCKETSRTSAGNSKHIPKEDMTYQVVLVILPEEVSQQMRCVSHRSHLLPGRSLGPVTSEARTMQPVY